MFRCPGLSRTDSVGVTLPPIQSLETIQKIWKVQLGDVSRCVGGLARDKTSRGKASSIRDETVTRNTTVFLTCRKLVCGKQGVVEKERYRLDTLHTQVHSDPVHTSASARMVSCIVPFTASFPRSFPFAVLVERTDKRSLTQPWVQELHNRRLPMPPPNTGADTGNNDKLRILLEHNHNAQEESSSLSNVQPTTT